MLVGTINSQYSSIREQSDQLNEHGKQIATGVFDIDALIGITKCERNVEMNVAVIGRASEMAAAVLEMSDTAIVRPNS